MDNKTAISILNKQIDKLKLSKENRTDSWTIETKQYIISFFGEDSIQKDFFNGYSWVLNPNSDLDWQEKQVIAFLNDCINTIRNIGLYKKEKPNFLVTLPNWIISAVLPGLFALGLLAGKCSSDYQNVKLKQDNILYQDTLSSIRKNTDNKSKIISKQKKNSDLKNVIHNN
jgi:hypothetical protein